MIRLPSKHSTFLAWPVLGVIATCLFVSACAGDTATSSTTSASPSPTVRPTASPTARPTPAPTGRTYTHDAPTPIAREGWTVNSLVALAPSASAYIESFGGSGLGVAVAFPDQGTVYALNGDQQFGALSVAKLPIMLAFIEKAQLEGRALTDDDLALLKLMITESDNTAADALWIGTGGAKGVNAVLTTAGFPGLQFDRDAWGESTLSTQQIATLLASLLRGDAFSAETSRLALDLMGEVVPWQTWGTLAGVPSESAVGIKNGWYPEPEGWALNSAAYVLPSDGEPYTIAIFTTGSRNYFTARAEIETIAAAIHADIYARR